jgi:hypothetical protein
MAQLQLTTEDRIGESSQSNHQMRHSASCTCGGGIQDASELMGTVDIWVRVLEY